MLRMTVRKKLPGFLLDADFSCEADGVIALFGRSGAGKTTLINMLAGLVRPDEGRIEVAGHVLFDSAAGINLPPEARHLGYVFQEGRLFPHMSVRANLAYGRAGEDHGGSAIEWNQVVELLGLSPLLARRPRDLSGGEKQRVALGRALLANPYLLLMDEPLASLDQPRKDEIMPFVERLRDDVALPIIYVSHAMPEIVRLADTLVLMSDGRVVAVGAIEELTSRLDLRPLTGRYEAGSVLSTHVERQFSADYLTELAFQGGRLLVPRIDREPGDQLRVRIRARDVALARQAPAETSLLNVLPARIEEISEEQGPQQDVRLDVGGTALWARITTRSRRVLDLNVGDRVYALVKAVAIDGQGLGRRRRRAAPET